MKFRDSLISAISAANLVLLVMLLRVSVKDELLCAAVLFFLDTVTANRQHDRVPVV